MQTKSALLPIGIGLGAYCSAWSLNTFGLFQPQDFALLQPAMHMAIAAGLYLNVAEINIREVRRNLKVIAAVLFLGVPIKILVPGLLLSPFLPIPVAMLCATVIAQIDPILAAKNINPKRFSPKAATLMRCWSSFDDPITVLFAFYLFLPQFSVQAVSLPQYFSNLGLEIYASFLIYTISRLWKPLQQGWGAKLIIFATCIGSGIAGAFITAGTLLLPASLGLYLRPFTNEKLKTAVLNLIFGFSAFVIGALAANLDLHWRMGVALAMGTFFIAQPLVTMLFFRDERNDVVRVMFGHQNGMTAILLTIALELAIDDVQLLSITLPAILAIAAFYTISNYITDQLLAKAHH
ncbi:cation:proton antiporter [Leptothoe kymatousa]|uniref:Uncharacterized protein n=1 Tax=Leptothoe kymatousa TAU-MAC 1615 TaxID=2364775 RepID=A0ABS5Y552_9CYAN|nr:hypothetical protein [Leptothoe kymatousa]MBT9312941.1 hypothetical protein [Leptothoe kymatousa TAU-MAC 1615]